MSKTGTLVTFDAMRDTIQTHIAKGSARDGLSTGWKGLDEFYLLKKGTLNVVTGLPSSGKSEWMDQVILESIALHDWHWTVFSPENWPLAQHFQKFAEKWTGKPMFGDDTTECITPDDIRTCITELSQSIGFINPPSDDMTINPILDTLKVSVEQNLTDAFILDPWNELEHNRPSNMTETEYIGQALTKLRNFGRRNGVAMFIVAHPTKLQKRDDGNYPVPTPYDISGSSNWRNKADACITVWRDYMADDNVVEIHVQKIRSKNNGRLGMARLYWNRKNGLFFNTQFELTQEDEHGIRKHVKHV